MRALFHVLILVILGILIVQNVSYASEPVVIEKSGRRIKVDGEKLGKEASLAYISDNLVQMHPRGGFITQKSGMPA